MSAKDVYANILLFKLSAAGKVLWSSPYGEGTGASVAFFASRGRVAAGVV